MGVINDIIEAILKCICCEDWLPPPSYVSPQPSVKSRSEISLPSPHATVRTIGSFSRTAPRYTGAEPEFPSMQIGSGQFAVWVPEGRLFL
jgi:hypothetical protein